MHDGWILLSRIVIWSAVTPLFLFTFLNWVSFLVLCPVAFLPLLPFTLFVSLRAPRLKIKTVGVDVHAFSASVHHSHYNTRAWKCVLWSRSKHFEKDNDYSTYGYHLWLYHYIRWVSNIICNMHVMFLLHALMKIFPRVIYKVCVFVCVCEVSAGCENGHCTVEFRRPEGKRAEVRWTTPSFTMRSEGLFVEGFVWLGPFNAFSC